MVKYTQHKSYYFNHFKVCNPGTFSTFRMLCNYHSCHIHYPRRKAHIHYLVMSHPCPPQPLASTDLLSVSVDLPLLSSSFLSCLCAYLRSVSSISLHVLCQHGCDCVVSVLASGTNLRIMVGASCGQGAAETLVCVLCQRAWLRRQVLKDFSFE